MPKKKIDENVTNIETPTASIIKENDIKETITNSLGEVTSLSHLAAQAKKRAFTKKVVTITSNDVRDNHSTSAIYATCENEYFSIARLIPLNVPVELEQCLIDTLKDIKIPLYKDEVKNGSPTGNVSVASVAKYSVSVE